MKNYAPHTSRESCTSSTSTTPVVIPRICITLGFPIAVSTNLRKFGNIFVGGPGFLVNYHDDAKDINVHYEITTITNITIHQMNSGHLFKISVASRANSAPHIEGIRTCLFETRHIHEISTHSVIVELQPIPKTTVRFWATNDHVFESIADSFTGSCPRAALLV